MVTFAGEFSIWKPGDPKGVLVVEGVALSEIAVTMTMQFAITNGASSSLGILIEPSQPSVALIIRDHPELTVHP